MGLFPIFPDPEEMAIPPLLFMLVIYGTILMKASQTISNGCEMLLLIYGPGIIGGLLIPILGAIPDCAVILISGLGPGTQSEVQDQLRVGVGTLVGSTVMLLTVPWAAGVYLGRRDYDPSTGLATVSGPNRPKLTLFSWTHNCVTVLDDIPGTAKIMMLSALSYCIIQIPAFIYHNNLDGGAAAEQPYALIGVIVTSVAFAVYCYIQYTSAAQSEIVRRHQEAARREQWRHSLDKRLSQEAHQELVFRSHDKDRSGYIEAGELSSALAALGLKVGRRDVKQLLESIDIGNATDGDAGIHDGKVSLNEFKAACSVWVTHGQSAAELHERHQQKLLNKTTLSRNSSINNGLGQSVTTNTTATSSLLGPNSKNSPAKYGTTADIESNSISSLTSSHSNHNDNTDTDSDGGDEDEEESEEEFWELTDSQLKYQAIGILLFGTLICTVFSDPLVDVISQVGTRININPFYISFVVTPLASNASEVIAGIVFAKKKTTESISLTLATLHGAATMNSTLGLCIFMCLVYFRKLSWSFTAEVITVILVLIVVGLNGLKKTIFLWQVIIVGLMYPIAIFLVWSMENLIGLD